MASLWAERLTKHSQGTKTMARYNSDHRSSTSLFNCKRVLTLSSALARIDAKEPRTKDCSAADETYRTSDSWEPQPETLGVSQSDVCNTQIEADWPSYHDITKESQLEVWATIDN